ncbi:hypothetical protein N0V90_009057 [Kalmusia sp. IMI 367209]|nr:hypothetical protein N0V90_009057 [Kalmusia sp. IMI 367209]
MRVEIDLAAQPSTTKAAQISDEFDNADIKDLPASPAVFPTDDDAIVRLVREMIERQHKGGQQETLCLNMEQALAIHWLSLFLSIEIFLLLTGGQELWGVARRVSAEGAVLVMGSDDQEFICKLLGDLFKLAIGQGVDGDAYESVAWMREILLGAARLLLVNYILHIKD